TPASATHLTFSTQPPASSAAGASFTVVVQALDAFGNLATGFTGPVTVGFGTDPSGGTATLGGTKTVSASGGVASFSLSVDKAFAGYTLSTTSSLPAISSSAFAITPTT